MLDELAAMERSAGKFFARVGSDTRQPYFPTFRGVPVVAVHAVRLDDLRAWLSRVRDALTLASEGPDHG